MLIQSFVYQVVVHVVDFNIGMANVDAQVSCHVENEMSNLFVIGLCDVTT